MTLTEGVETFIRVLSHTYFNILYMQMSIHAHMIMIIYGEIVRKVILTAMNSDWGECPLVFPYVSGFVSNREGTV